jgi:CRISPR-associated endonuclease Csn1
MNKEKVVLGLDIGVGSIGWGLVKLTEEKYTDEKPDGTIVEKYKISDGKIIDTGIRAFQLSQDEKKESLALKRGTARRSRRTTRRKAQRLKRLMGLAKEFNLINDNFDRYAILKPKEGDKESKWDIWFIRKQALERKLSDDELFRVLYHIAKHRGFYFHTKAEEMEEEDKKSEEGKEKARVKAGLSRIKKKLKDGGWETIGQMFCEEFQQTNKENKRKRNAPDKYENSIHRSLLKEEIETIFERQQQFGNSKAAKELKQRYINGILMKEEGPDDEKLQRMMGRCEFTGELCAPKEGYTSERFTLFNQLNTLELVDTRNKDKHLQLDKDQRDKIIALAYENAKVTFAQTRTALELQDKLHTRFNRCSYREKNPEYNKKLECEVKNGKLQFNEKHKVPIVDINTGEVKILDKEIKVIFLSKKLWPNAKKIYVYYSDIRKQLNLSEDFRFNLSGYTKSAAEFGSETKYIKQFEGDTLVELKGYHKIKNAIEENCGGEKWGQISGDTAKLDTIAEALTYCKSDETRKDYLLKNGISDESIIEAVLTINMKQLATYSKEALSNLLKYMEAGALFNDAKKKCGYDKLEYDKQAILQPYGGFFENNPVVARVVSQTRKLVNALVRKYQKHYTIDQIHIEVATELASSKKRKSQIAQGQRRYKDAKKAAEERCREEGLDPEEGQNLLMFRLAEEQNYFCPYTRAKITLCPTGAANEVYIQDCEIDHIIPMSRSFNDSLNNKVLCTQKANQDKRDRIPFEWFEETYGKDSQRWIEFENTVKKMYSMPYPKRKNLLRKSWTEKDKEKFLSRNLNDTRYAARHIADYLRKYFDFSISERDDIKDVSRVKVRSGGVTAFLRHMWGLRKDREESDLHHSVDALVVACSTDGHVYLISNLAKEIERKGENWYKRFGFIRGKFKPWDSIREDIQEAVGNVFVSRMPRHKVTAAAHKETILSFKKAPTKNRVIKTNCGYAEIGEMVRADVFTDEVGRNYVVPIYSVDIFSNKELPDKYLHKNDAPYYEWPSVKDDNLKFKFSLFKDDLIRIDEQMYYIDHIRGTRPLINVKNIDGSVFESNNKESELGYRNVRLKKYSVDMLGNYKEVKQEKRLGSRFENNKKMAKE